MRIWPSQSTVIKRKVGSTVFVDHGQIQTIALGDSAPVMNAGAAKRINAQAELRAANDVHVNHIAEIGDVSS